MPGTVYGLQMLCLRHNEFQGWYNRCRATQSRVSKVLKRVAEKLPATSGSSILYLLMSECYKIVANFIVAFLTCYKEYATE